MQNKPNPKNRDDIKVVITALALTLTLGFWNVFSNGAKKPIQAATNVEPIVPTQMAQVKILMGGPPPKTTIIVSQTNSVQPRNQQNNQQRNQQTVQQSAPQPVTNTASSK
jgi:hypothetical protein